MKKLTFILSTALLVSQGALADPLDARGGFNKEQMKTDREHKLQRDKACRSEKRYRDNFDKIG